jgi:hypothetical protein
LNENLALTPNQMCCLFSVFFVALPVIVLIASFLSPWVREKTVAAITTSVHCFIYLTLIYTLWPTRAPRYFEVRNLQRECRFLTNTHC